MKDLVLLPGVVEPAGADDDADAEVKAEITRLWDLGLNTAEFSARTGVKTRRIQSWAEAGKLTLTPRGRGVGSKPNEDRQVLLRSKPGVSRSGGLGQSLIVSPGWPGPVGSCLRRHYATPPPSKIQVEGGIDLLPQ